MNRNIGFIVFIMWLSNCFGYMVLTTRLLSLIQTTPVKGE